MHSMPNNHTDDLDNGIIPQDSTDDEVQTLYVEAFLHNNRFEHIIQVMGYHPRYLSCFIKTQNYLLRGDGALPYAHRHYIAIMAAGRHQCSYLISTQTNEFLTQGGDPTWLKGLQYVPKKLQDLYEVNKILAHRPWLLTKAHIEKLTRGSDNWSMVELMQAIVILTHFHALSSFVYGCGINAEIDSEDGHTFRPPSPSSSQNSQPDSPSQSLVNSAPVTVAVTANAVGKGGKCGGGHNGSLSASAEEVGSGGVGIEILMERMRRLTEEAQEEMTQEELQKRFERVEVQSAELPSSTKPPCPKADILRYVEDAEFTYQDFTKRGSQGHTSTFRAQDYSWEEQGYSLANRLYSNIGRLLDVKFTTAKELTYYTMGDRTEVDTTSFRRAIWNYIHCLYGIRHDDYDYKEVNHLLERTLKAYIKTVTCYPERITRRDYNSFMREFQHSEKVHVNLMLLEARMQAELLYALRAIMKYMV
jgi:sestrin